MGHIQQGSPRCTWSREANEAEEEGHRQLCGVSAMLAPTPGLAGR